MPVNLAGVLKSLEQAITGEKIPFARTPKVKNRTPASLLYIFGPLLIVGFSIVTVWRNYGTQNWGNALFATFNTITALWAIVAYIGPGNILADIWLQITNWLYVEDTPKQRIPKPLLTPKNNWRTVLYHGEMKGAVPFLAGSKAATNPAHFSS